MWKINALLLAVLAGCASAGNFSPRWIPQDSGTGASLRGVCAVNEYVAWASGSQGTFLRTRDGGETWECGKVRGAEDLDFRDIHAVDENTALVLCAGEPAKIFKTSDGGRRWTELYVNDTPGVFFDAMAFWDRSRGLAFGDPVNGSFLLVLTADGGRTWEEVSRENLPPPHPGEAGFAASGTCACVRGKNLAWFATGGSASRVFRSDDGGRSWKTAASPLLGGKPSRGIFSIAFEDDLNGVIVGGDYTIPDGDSFNAAWTNDGGRTWNLVERSPPGGYRSCAAYVRKGRDAFLIAVGASGCDYSLDGGKSWTGFGTGGYHSVSFAGASGWAVGAEGRIASFRWD